MHRRDRRLDRTGRARRRAVEVSRRDVLERQPREGVVFGIAPPRWSAVEEVGDACRRRRRRRARAPGPTQRGGCSRRAIRGTSRWRPASSTMNDDRGAGAETTREASRLRASSASSRSRRTAPDVPTRGARRRSSSPRATTTTTRASHGRASSCRRDPHETERRADRHGEPERHEAVRGQPSREVAHRDADRDHDEPRDEEPTEEARRRSVRARDRERHRDPLHVPRGTEPEPLAVRVDELSVESRPAEVAVLRGLGGDRSGPGDRGEDAGARDEAARRDGQRDVAGLVAGARSPRERGGDRATRRSRGPGTADGRVLLPRGAAPRPTTPAGAGEARGRGQEATPRAPGSRGTRRRDGRRRRPRGARRAATPPSCAAAGGADQRRGGRPDRDPERRCEPRRHGRGVQLRASRRAPPRAPARPAGSPPSTGPRSPRRASTRGRRARPGRRRSG